MIGKTILHYKILSKLGEGGMGVVYMAEDTRLERTVAIKFLPPHIAGNRDERQRFETEAKAAASLNHNNIATIYAIEEAEEGLFIVMEYIAGQELSEAIAASPIPIEKTLAIANQVASGLHAAHEQGVVHRDIKSSNIMLTEKGNVKIMDFGLAKRGGQILTKEGTTLGTVAYMSPEQSRGDDVDPRSDIFSLGVLIYEMITGGLPFKGDYDQAITYSILNEAPEPVTALRTGVPLDLERLIIKCLEKDPSLRYQRAEEVAVDLSRLRQDKGPQSRTGSGLAVNPKKKPRFAILAAIIVGLGVLTFVAAQILNKSPEGSADSPGINRIAVLPLEGIGDNSDKDLLADGLTRQLITTLTKTEVPVLGHRAVARFQNSDLPLSEIARELDVDAVVVGSVGQIADQLQVTIELMDPKTRENHWAETYAKPMTEIITLRNEIAREIAVEIKSEITPEQAVSLAKAQQVSPEAFAQFVLGQQQSIRWTQEGFRRSVEHFERAIAMEPNFAPAHAWLARTYGEGVFYGWVDPDSGRAIIYEAVDAALALDDQLGDAYVARAFAQFHIDWEFDKAEETFRQGIALSPTAASYTRFAIYLTTMRRFDEAIDMAERAIDLEPGVAQWHNDLGWWYLAAENYDRAIERAKISVALDSTFAEVHELMALVYTEQGLYEEAWEEWGTHQALYGEITPGQRSERLRLYQLSGDRDRAEEQLRILQKSQETNRGLSRVAYAHMVMGNLDSAFVMFERAIDIREKSLPTILNRRPALVPFREHPPYQALLRQIGLPQ